MLVNKSYHSTLKFHLKIEFSSQSSNQSPDQEHTLNDQFISRDEKLQCVRMGRIAKKEERMERSAESRRTDVMKTNENETRAGGRDCKCERKKGADGANSELMRSS